MLCKSIRVHQNQDLEVPNIGFLKLIFWEKHRALCCTMKSPGLGIRRQDLRSAPQHGSSVPWAGHFISLVGFLCKMTGSAYLTSEALSSSISLGCSSNQTLSVVPYPDWQTQPAKAAG